MSNAIYKGKIYNANYYPQKGEKSIIIRSRYNQEEEGFLPTGDGRYYKYLSPKEIEEFYDFNFYAVFGEARCFILSVSKDMETMDLEEWGRVLFSRYSFVQETDRGCFLYTGIQLKDADSFVLKIRHLKKPEFKRIGSENEISLTYEEFVKKYRSMVTDV